MPESIRATTHELFGNDALSIAYATFEECNFTPDFRVRDAVGTPAHQLKTLDRLVAGAPIVTSQPRLQLSQSTRNKLLSQDAKSFRRTTRTDQRRCGSISRVGDSTSMAVV
jgi:hypothetical protein